MKPIGYQPMKQLHYSHSAKKKKDILW